ncbi:MAG: thiamine pyrophosphate-binding protein [Geminicoccaceae bacterium]
MMNRLSGAEALVRMLDGYGVRHVFGLCGDTSLPLYDALVRLDHGIAHILTRDERHAAYMADAYARFSGRVGVCEGPSGGGATYILPGLAEANESSSPVLALNSDVSVAGRGRYVLTELDQAALFRPVTKWNAVVDAPARLPAALRRAFRELTTGRPGAVHLGLPYDVLAGPVDEAEVRIDRTAPHRPAPAAADIAPFVERLRKARRPLAICGGGVIVAGAEAALRRVAEALPMAVATTISGKGSLPEDHPLAVGVVGSNGGTPETRALVDAADLILFVGCRAGSVTTERWRHPVPGAVAVLHIDIDPAVPGTNYPTEAALVGDARAALEAIAAALESASADDPRPAVASAKASKRAAFLALAEADATPIRPERVVDALDRLLDDDAVLVADPGTPCPYLSAFWRARRPGRRFLSNRAHGALGYALPAVVGAATACPGAKPVAVMGDGSFAMACGELETIHRLRLPVTLVVISNATFGWIKAGQRSGFGSRYFGVDFGRTDHAAVARAFGLAAFTVERPDDVLPTLHRALAMAEPVLVDILCQPLHEARAPVSEWVA